MSDIFEAIHNGNGKYSLHAFVWLGMAGYVWLSVCVCECVLRVAGKTHSCVVIESKPKRSDCPKTTEFTKQKEIHIHIYIDKYMCWGQPTFSLSDFEESAPIIILMPSRGKFLAK